MDTRLMPITGWREENMYGGGCDVVDEALHIVVIMKTAYRSGVGVTGGAV